MLRCVVVAATLLQTRDFPRAIPSLTASQFLRYTQQNFVTRRAFEYAQGCSRKADGAHLSTPQRPPNIRPEPAHLSQLSHFLGPAQRSARLQRERTEAVSEPIISIIGGPARSSAPVTRKAYLCIWGCKVATGRQYSSRAPAIACAVTAIIVTRLAGGGRARMRSVACIPSRSGICTSIRTTS